MSPLDGALQQLETSVTIVVNGDTGKNITSACANQYISFADCQLLQQLWDSVHRTALVLSQLITFLETLTVGGGGPAGATVEETRQYLLARLRANPIGVMTEAPHVITEAAGPYTPPPAAAGTPHVGLPAMRDDLRAFVDDPAHPVRVAADQLIDDLRAFVDGQAPIEAVWPTSVAEVPGAAPPPGPAPADPDATDLLTPADLTAVQQTTTLVTA